MKIALIPGHTKSSAGATNYKGEAEYPWAKRVLTNAIHFMPKIQCEIITRDNGGIEQAVKEAKKRGCVACVELHFNWAESDPKTDIEILADKRLPKSIKMAKFLAKKENELYPSFGLRRDEGCFATSPSDRGGHNVAQAVAAGIEYSILWEPQFGNLKNEDSMALFENENKFSKLIGDSLTEFFTLEGLIASNSVPAPIPGPMPMANLKGLVEAYKSEIIEFSNLKAISLAQWLLESGRVSSPLSIKHFNFGGLKFRPDVPSMPVGAKSFPYQAHDGLENYFKCDSYETFFKLYWRFLDRSPYRGWRDHANDPVAFIKHVGPIYCPNAQYVNKVLALLPDAKKLLGE